MYLNCHTYYSLKYGTISPEALLEEAKLKGVKNIALTDINNTSALIDILRRSSKYDVRIVAGIDFRNGADQQFIGLAKNNHGFYELNKFLSEHNHAEKDIPPTAPCFEQVFVIYPYGKKQPHELKENEYMGLRISEMGKLLFTEWRKYQEKIVILHPVTFKTKKDFNAHRILRAIDTNALLSQLPKTEEAKPDEIMLSELELEKIFENYPKIIENTKRILEECSIEFNLNNEHGHNNQQSYTKSEEEDLALMKKTMLPRYSLSL